MIRELETAVHQGEYFTGASHAIERHTLPVILDRVKHGTLRVYRIPGLPGKYFKTTELEHP